MRAFTYRITNGRSPLAAPYKAPKSKARENLHPYGFRYGKRSRYGPTAACHVCRSENLGLAMSHEKTPGETLTAVNYGHPRTRLGPSAKVFHSTNYRLGRQF